MNKVIVGGPKKCNQPRLYSAFISQCSRCFANSALVIDRVEPKGKRTLPEDLPKRSPNPQSANMAYWKVNFQNHILIILRTYSSSSLKGVYTNYFSFLEIPARSGSNQQKTTFSVGKLNLPSISMVFCIFEQLLIGIFKKEWHFEYTLFEEESESTIRFSKV